MKTMNEHGTEPEKLGLAVLEILKRGNDAQVRRQGDGFLVLEVKKEIRYRSDPSGPAGHLP